jgi:exosortase/archaeosortase family protein
MRPAADFGVNVIWGCTTSYAASAILSGFVIVVLALRRAWRRSDFAWLAGLLLATFAVNILRLVITSMGREQHQFWHDGAGTAVFAIAYMLLVGAFALLATRGQRPQLAA